MTEEIIVTEYIEESIESVEASTELECRICLQTTCSSWPLNWQIEVQQPYLSTVLSLRQVMSRICMIAIDSDVEERLPDSVCEECKSALIAAFRLRVIAQKADESLRDRLLEMEKAQEDTKDNIFAEIEEDQYVEVEEVLEILPSASDIESKQEHQQNDSDEVLKEDKPYACITCKKSFRERYKLQEHMRSHTSETHVLCSECGKGFSTNAALIKHIQSHKGVKPFACEHCPSRFVTRRSWKEHQTRHTGERPYTCDICSKTFTRDYALFKHRRIHTGERPYSCEHCVKSFITSNHLARHVRIHTGEKPYKCKFCDRAFGQNVQLNQHMKSHVGECTYQCEQCTAAFKYHSELRLHIEEHFREAKELLKKKTTGESY